jgi:CMP-N-acetylneuraminic acid synthetase
MQDSVKIAALVPMRHQSERVPHKNYRNFAGKPLCTHILSTLSNCSLVNHILVDTDSDEIKQLVKQRFPDISVVDRPLHLRDGTVPMNDVLLHDVKQIDADFYLQTHSTNPLLQAKTIDRAIEELLENYPLNDSLFGVTRLQTRLWDGLALPVNHNRDILLRTQDLPPIYEENSNIYIFTRDILERKHNRIGDRPMLFEIDRLEAWDIDEELDFSIAEFLHQNRQGLSE